MQRTALVLGSHGNIGQGVVERFIGAGYRVVAPSRNELDLSDAASIDRYVLSAGIKQLHALVSCVGINNAKPFEENTLADYVDALATNVLGFARVCQLVAPLLKQSKGCVVAVSSVYGQVGLPGRSSYVMSKHALNGLVKTLAVEWGKHGIKVNTLSPGFMDVAMAGRQHTPERKAALETKIPLGRLATPADVAAAALFLCSDDNGYITGQDIVLDGGYLAGGFQQ